jgi:hypothetical protein
VTLMFRLKCRAVARCAQMYGVAIACCRDAHRWRGDLRGGGTFLYIVVNSTHGPDHCQPWFASPCTLNGSPTACFQPLQSIGTCLLDMAAVLLCARQVCPNNKAFND